MKPKRIQRRRTKGWKMPPNTVYVGRGSRWGNPYKVEGDITQKKAVQLYAEEIIPYRHKGDKSSLHHFLLSVANMDDIKHSLKGKNLACWCRLDQPCHADVLLEIANHE